MHTMCGLAGSHYPLRSKISIPAHELPFSQLLGQNLEEGHTKASRLGGNSATRRLWPQRRVRTAGNKPARPYAALGRILSSAKDGRPTKRFLNPMTTRGARADAAGRPPEGWARPAAAIRLYDLWEAVISSIGFELDCEEAPSWQVESKTRSR